MHLHVIKNLRWAPALSIRAQIMHKKYTLKTQNLQIFCNIRQYTTGIFCIDRTMSTFCIPPWLFLKVLVDWTPVKLQVFRTLLWGTGHRGTDFVTGEKQIIKGKVHVLILRNIYILNYLFNKLNGNSPRTQIYIHTL